MFLRTLTLWYDIDERWQVQMSDRCFDSEISKCLLQLCFSEQLCSAQFIVDKRAVSIIKHIIVWQYDCFLVLPNLALNKATLSSSNFPDGISSPSNVVDGNFDTNYFGTRSCYSTDAWDRTGNAWWAVDLGAAYDIQYVVVTNRGDGGGKFV